MRTASEILDEHGIRLRNHRDGNQKTLCPKCSHTRRNKREPCLSVEVGADGVRFLCHNCGFKGGDFFEANARQAQHGQMAKRLPRKNVASIYAYRPQR